MFLLICCQSIFAQQDFIFSNLNEKDGLSNNMVYCFLKDSRGIFWIGTKNGLNRFDGSNFYTYKVKRNANSIPDGVVSSLCEDKKGNIWGATNNGIFCYVPDENRFINYFPLNSRYSNNFLNILLDKDGNIWAGGWIALLKFDTAKNSFMIMAQTSSYDSARQFSMRKNCMLLDPSGNGIWMATRSGMFYYDTKKDFLLSSANQPGNPLFARHNVAALAKSPAGHYWYFDNDTRDVIAFSPATKSILFKVNVQKKMPNAIGANIYEDRQNRLWLSSWSQETILVEYKKNKLINISSQQQDALSISGWFVWNIQEDADGTIWFGTGNGLYKCNPGKVDYKRYHLPEKVKILENTSIAILKEDPLDNSLWILTIDLRLIHYKKISEKYDVFILKEILGKAAGKELTDVFALEVYDNNIVICTNIGLWYLPGSKKKIVPLNIPALLKANFNAGYFLNAGDSIYYFSNIKSVLYLNRKTGETKLYKFDVDTLPNGAVPTCGLMVTDNKKRPWIITGGGWISTILGDKLHPTLIAKNSAGESIGYFNALIADKAGNLWMSNEQTGLYYYNTFTGQIKYWDEADGIKIPSADKIIEDEYGNIRLLKRNKVSILNPVSNSVFNFNIPISDRAFNYYNSVEKLHSGKILYSIYNDLVEFNSQPFDIAPFKPKPAVSYINVSGKEYLIAGQDKLVLNPDENNIRFRFGLLIDKEIFPYDLEYMLEGAEKNWTIVEVNKEATYNNLASGSYTFKIRAKGKNNKWESEEKTFTIVIKKPFYKTIWFIAAVFILAISLIFIIYRYQLSQKAKMMQLESKTQLLEKEKALVKYENLKQQLNPHFLFNSLSSLRSLIRIKPTMATEFLDGLSKTYRYLLRSGDSELVSLKEELDFVEIFVQLQKTRFDAGLQLSINIPEVLLAKKIAPVTIQGLIENAIKHNMIDEESPLQIEIFAENEIIIVRNNLQKIAEVETSNKKGLAALQTLYRYYTDRPLTILEDEKYFTIKIPLI